MPILLYMFTSTIRELSPANKLGHEMAPPVSVALQLIKKLVAADSFNKEGKYTTENIKVRITASNHRITASNHRITASNHRITASVRENIRGNSA